MVVVFRSISYKDSGVYRGIRGKTTVMSQNLGRGVKKNRTYKTYVQEMVYIQQMVYKRGSCI